MSDDKQVIKVAAECFDAAYSEGWAQALAEGDIDAIRDLWSRRISFAHVILVESRDRK